MKISAFGYWPPVLTALFDVFLEEAFQILEFSEPCDGDQQYRVYYENELKRHPVAEEEILFAMLVSKFCNPFTRLGAGRGKNSSHQQRLKNEWIDAAVPIALTRGKSGMPELRAAMEKLGITICQPDERLGSELAWETSADGLDSARANSVIKGLIPSLKRRLAETKHSKEMELHSI